MPVSNTGRYWRRTLRWVPPKSLLRKLPLLYNKLLKLLHATFSGANRSQHAMFPDTFDFIYTFLKAPEPLAPARTSHTATYLRSHRFAQTIRPTPLAPRLNLPYPTRTPRSALLGSALRGCLQRDNNVDTDARAVLCGAPGRGLRRG